uniref:ATP synthase F0 subunit 6 n=1 Tax=Erythrolobus coxiae TaxID=362235 RepID=UPI001FCDE8A8|nr:ATP synthase F0 subunit 6 [Erythrolobus coxiae]UNJ18999.1 ATP synthase F0 subunit 6 [Erythrolobus coxiae]
MDAKIFFSKNPLEQFEIFSIIKFLFFDINFSFTNFSLFLFIISILTILWFFSLILVLKIIPFNWQLLFEKIYLLVCNILQENLQKSGHLYFPFVFVLFVFLLFLNLGGMMPFGFTITSHILCTFSLSFSIFLGINLIAFFLNKSNILCLFLPKNVPLIIVPLLILIEFISYFVKVFTLAIRLFTNMTSGHTLLKIIASFIWVMLSLGASLSILHCFPLVLLSVLIFLELGISILQAYVFVLLIVIYMNDVYEIH